MTDRHAFPVRASETLHVGRILALRLDHVEMPGGRIVSREVVEHTGAVAVVPLDDEQQVVLIEQYRHSVGRRLWELPAGLLDTPGEDPLDTARRELAEEVGLSGRSWTLLADVVTSPGFSDESVRVFLTRGLSELTRPDGPDDEEADLTVRRVPLTDAVSAVLAGEIVNGPTIAGLLATFALLTGAATARPVDSPWPDRPTHFPGRRCTSGRSGA